MPLSVQATEYWQPPQTWGCLPFVYYRWSLSYPVRQFSYAKTQKSQVLKVKPDEYIRALKPNWSIFLSWLSWLNMPLEWQDSNLIIDYTRSMECKAFLPLLTYVPLLECPLNASDRELHLDPDDLFSESPPVYVVVKLHHTNYITEGRSGKASELQFSLL